MVVLGRKQLMQMQSLATSRAVLEQWLLWEISHFIDEHYVKLCRKIALVS